MAANWYTHRDVLKESLTIPACTTANHTFLDQVLETVARNIDRHLGFHLYPSSGIRYFRPRQTTYLDLDYPLLNIDAIALDTNADSSYESTLDSTSYYMVPYNATEESPRQPWWAIEIRTRTNASAIFPIRVAQGVRITGTWGYYNERDETTCRPATAMDATQLTMKMTGATNLHPGQTIRVDSEQIFVVANGLSGSDTATTSGIIAVKRAQNGTPGATHSSLSTASIYTYPVVSAAALYQAGMDYRAKDAPLGITGTDPTWNQTVRAPGGFHPFVRRLLDEAFRTPRVG